MPATRITMRKIKDVLRLKLGANNPEIKTEAGHATCPASWKARNVRIGSLGVRPDVLSKRSKRGRAIL
jgi:hypothetical protein